MAEQALQDMLQKLIEDRQKREEEIEHERIRREEERVQREKEIAEERARREEERLQREREVAEERMRRERDAREKVEEMRAQMDRLMKIVEEQKSASASKGTTELSVKLVALTELDDIESYLVTFERIMTAHKVDKGRWPHYLAPQLTGKAQLAFAALPVSDSADYDAIKAAILVRYDINEDAFKNRFRSSKRKDGETNREFAVRMMDSLTKWLKEYKTVDQVHQVVGIEQLLSSLPVEKRLWLVERKPKTCLQAGEWLDEYEQARRQDVRPLKQRDNPVPAKEPGDAYGNKDAGPKNSQPEQRNPQRHLPRCYNCHKVGHVASKCPRNASTFYGGRAKQSEVKRGHSSPRKLGYVEGTEVKDIVLDTGAARTLVRDNLVPRNKYLDKFVSVQCVHGDHVSYPLAKVKVVIDGRSYFVEAAVVKKLPASVLLGRDVPELVQIGGATEEVLAAMTRAQAKQRAREEESASKKEKESGVTCRDLSPARVTKMNDEEKRSPGPAELEKNADPQQEDTKVSNGVKEITSGDSNLGVDGNELRKLQREDETLRGVWDSAKQPSKGENYWFYEEDGLLYRHWHPREEGEEFSVEQLIVPKQYRETVLRIAHEIPLAGHMGKKKTVDRIMQRFYWPTLYRDVAEWCRTCEKCQKHSPIRNLRAPLVPLPVIEEPFTRIAMDVVGPLPRSSSGHEYILVVCDYATRYPEAIPMKAVDAEHVAEELVTMFSRVGVPSEILTDQGTNFMSKLLSKLYRLLHVRRIRTSPYHPQTDGLVERFNGTLKSMLRKTAVEGKDWDKLLPYLLFAYREVPQASTGFSPFELMYGRHVRGPLDILRETWKASKRSDESV